MSSKNWIIKCNKNIHYPYVIVDNWFSNEELNVLFSELDFYRKSGEYFNSGIRAEQCKTTAKRDGKSISSSVRFYPDSYYKLNSYGLSPILNFRSKLANEKIHNYIKTECGVFGRTYGNTNNTATQVSYYENDDYYDTHIDTFDWTVLIWVYKTPKKFEGGNLHLNDLNTTISIKNNRALFFPSCLEHSVFPIKMNEEDKNKGLGRYTITNFVNYEIPVSYDDPNKSKDNLFTRSHNINWHDDDYLK